MMKFFLLYFVVCSSSVAAGQFSDSTKNFVRFGATGNINRTATSRAYLLNHEARFSHKSKRNVFNAFSGWVYGQANNSLSNNDVTVTADYNRYRDSSSLYYWGLANYTSSYSLRIINQLQTGAGFAYNVFNNERLWLNVSDGILYETSTIRVGDNDRDYYNTLRNSFRISFRLSLGNFNFTGTHFIQNSLRYRQDYIIRSSSGMELKLNQWINLNASFVYNQYRRTGAENLLFTYGLSAQRYF